MKLGFIGAGRMGGAFIRGLLKGGIKNICASDKNFEKLEELKRELGIEIAKNNKELVSKSDIIFLAVKPNAITDVLREIKEEVNGKLMISIAAGISLQKIQSELKKDAKVVRVMPNVACLVQESASAFCVNKNISKKDMAVIEKLLSSVGKVFLVNEKLMNSITALSGSGPAYISYVIESLRDGGVKLGLPKEIATYLAAQTALGTAKMILTGKEPSEVINMVSSPGGTTVAGMQVLEEKDVCNIFIKVVEKAAKRARELAR